MFMPERKKFKPRRPAATALAFAAEVRLFNPSTHAKAVNKKNDIPAQTTRCRISIE